MGKEIKQKADELVEMFGTIELMLTTNSRGRLTSPYKSGFIAMKAKEYEGLKCAILHQKRLIDELEGLFIDNNIDVMNEAEIRIYKKREEQKAILAELESRL